GVFQVGRGPSGVDLRVSAAIPDRADRGARPARTEAAAIVAGAGKAGPAEIVPVAVVTVIGRHRVDIPGTPVVARVAPQSILLHEERLAVAERLPIAWQEAIAVPAWRRLLVGGRSRRGHREQ